MKRKLAAWWKTAKLTANLMAGVPDYENYVAQQRKHNPNAPVMTELQFQDYCRKRAAVQTAEDVVNRLNG